MPNDTLRANARAIPIDRRAALSGLVAAGAMLIAPHAAKAASDDAEVFAALEHFGRLREAKEAADSLEELFPGQDAKKAADQAFNATYDAAEAMLRLRPQTIAGLRAIVQTLVDFGLFEVQDEGEALAQLLLEAPALGGEA